MNESLLSSMGFKLMLLLTAGISVGAMGVAASKATSAMDQNRIPKVGLEMAQPTPIAEVEQSPVADVASVDLKEIEVETKKKTEGKCIITLFSIKYDVTVPNNNGKNGDLFDCGGDMTSKYSSKYGTDVTRMQKYLLNPLVNTPTVMATTTIPRQEVVPTTSPKVTVAQKPIELSDSDDKSKSFRFEEDNDEREDAENEEKYEKETEHREETKLELEKEDN